MITFVFHCFQRHCGCWQMCLGAEVILQSENLSNRNRSKTNGSFCIGCPAVTDRNSCLLLLFKSAGFELLNERQNKMWGISLNHSVLQGRICKYTHIYHIEAFLLLKNICFLETPYWKSALVLFIIHCNLFSKQKNMCLENSCSQYCLASFKMHLRFKIKNTNQEHEMQFHNLKWCFKLSCPS